MDVEKIKAAALEIARKHMHTKHPGGAAAVVALVMEHATVPTGMVRVGVEDKRLLGTLPVTADAGEVGPDGHHEFHVAADYALGFHVTRRHGGPNVSGSRST